jgi:hypothetical protein
MSKTVVDKNGVGYIVIGGVSTHVKLCNCPKTWEFNKKGHHVSCIRSTTCFFCQMSRQMCERLGICKRGSFKKNPRNVEAEKKINGDIHRNVMSSLQRLFQQIPPLLRQIPDSDKKKSCFKRLLDCRSQYEAMKLLQNISSANVDSAEKCLYKLKCVYFDMKTMSKA